MSKNDLTIDDPGHSYCTMPDGSRMCTGAKMGVYEYRPEDRMTPMKLRVQKMYVSQDGYLHSGHYVGVGNPFYLAVSIEDVTVVGAAAPRPIRMCFRAPSRDLVKRQIKALLPNVKFYR